MEHKTRIMEDIMKFMVVIQQRENLMENIYSCKCKAPSVIEMVLASNTASKRAPVVVSAGVPTSDSAGTKESNVEEVLPCNLFN